jgi:hypothetical protein
MCPLHGGDPVTSDSEDTYSGFEPVAARTRGRKSEKVTSEEGCTKEFVEARGYTAGVLVVTRPCGVVIHAKELIEAESTHELLHELWVLRQRGLLTC